MNGAENLPNQSPTATKLQTPRMLQYTLTFLLILSLALILYTLDVRLRALSFNLGRGGFDFMILLIFPSAIVVLFYRIFRLQERWKQIVVEHFHSQDRLIGFNRTLFDVSQTIASTDTDTGLLQKICDLIVSQCPLKLAFICRPDETGYFKILCASGDTGYADGIVISTDPNIPEGQGTIGMSWHGGEIHYSQSFRNKESLAPWRQRAAQYGIGASATLPLRRSGKIFAVLVVFDGTENIFDEALTVLLPSLAKIISDGLDRIDLISHERRTQAFNQTMLDNSVVGIALTRHGKIQRLNKQLMNDMRAAGTSQLLGQPIVNFLLTPEIVSAVTVATQWTHEKSQEGHVRRLDQTIFWANITIRDIDDTNGDQIWQIQDITSQHDIKAQLEYVALHDPLTDLPNRYALEQYLQSAINHADATATVLAVGVLDLDDFKSYNDTFGHQAGDRLLCAVAERLRAELSPQDFFGHLGGDEFVITFAIAPGANTLVHIEEVMRRFEAAMRGEFISGKALSTLITMTLGLALYPDTTTDGNTLFRIADATMYQLKNKRLTRTTWWNVAGRELDETDHGQLVTYYGPATDELLRPLHNNLSATLPDEKPFFMATLEGMASSKVILGSLATSEVSHLIHMLTGHLLGLVTPSMTREEHEQRSKRLGRIHALLGIASADSFRVFSLYNAFVRQKIDQVTSNSLMRLRLNSVLQTRFSNELQFEQEGRWEIDIERQENFAAIQEDIEKWMAAGTFREELVKTLQNLSGIVGVAWGSSDNNNVYVIEYGAGFATPFIEALSAEGVDLIFGSGLPADQPCILRAWTTGNIEITRNLKTDPSMGALAPTAAKFGFRSAAAIPVFDETGLPIAILSILGSHPGQFSSPAAEIWLRSVQSLLQSSDYLSNTRIRMPVSVERRQAIRTALFGSGLHMAMQPIIDLRTGKLFNVEALARLEIAGTLMSPSEFLPTFGSNELLHLFRRGLEKSLSFLVESEVNLPGLSIALNIPPSVLEEPDCINWISQALAEHQIEPARLCLELVELGDSKSTLHRGAQVIADLTALGIHLVMDDLGSGHSSLQRLRNLPFDKVKIDQNLIAQAITDPEDTIPFIRGLIQIAHRLGLKVVAEGLASLDLIEMAAFLGADYGQGYALSRPLPLGQVAQWASQFKYDVDLGKPATYLGKLAQNERHRTLPTAGDGFHA